MSKKKIALVGYRLNKGGAERVMANLSNFFHEKGLEVHIIIFHDELGFSHSGKVFNLGKLKSKSNTIFNKIKRFYYFNKYIKSYNFNFIIDFRFRVNILQEFLISKWIYNTNTIYTVHSSKLDVYMPNYSPLTRFIYAKSFKVVSITKSMQRMILERHKLKNIIKIYNPIDIAQIKEKSNEKIPLDYEYIIGIGQYDTNVKQFDNLIKAYSKSILPEKKIALVILGSGKLKSYLLEIAKDCNVNHLVHLLGFKSNPYKYIKNSKFFTLTSKYEGLAMVMLEALACGTPAITFNCPTGPEEIIRHKENGLLIENQNIPQFIEGINAFVNDDKLYLKCKSNALKSVEKFSINTIGQQWLDLMNNN